MPGSANPGPVRLVRTQCGMPRSSVARLGLAQLAQVQCGQTYHIKIAIADALAGGRSVNYSLKGDLVAPPSEAKQRTFQVERSSALSPAPGLPGVMR